MSKVSAEWTVYQQMTEARAREAITAPLVFGDALQIEAKLYLEKLDTARMRMMHCKLCGGDGVRPAKRKSDGALCWCIEHEPAAIVKDLGVAVTSDSRRAAQH